MEEVIFVVLPDPVGGFVARALGESILTEADTLDDLRDNIRDAVRCHYEDDNAPEIIRLRIVQEEILTIQRLQER